MISTAELSILADLSEQQRTLVLELPRNQRLERVAEFLKADLPTVLASTPLATKCFHAHVDTEPRRAERPSDHAPVIVDLAL